MNLPQTTQKVFSNNLTNGVKDSVTEASKTSATTSNELTNGVKDSAESTKPSGANSKMDEDEDELDALLFLPLPVKKLNGKREFSEPQVESGDLRVEFGDLHVESGDSQATKRPALAETEKKTCGYRIQRVDGEPPKMKVFTRDAGERTAKRDIWSDKLSRYKNAHAKRVVENAFAAETPISWTGKTYVGRPAFVEKKVVFEPLILLDVADISA